MKTIIAFFTLSKMKTEIISLRMEIDLIKANSKTATIAIKDLGIKIDGLSNTLIQTFGANK